MTNKNTRRGFTQVVKNVVMKKDCHSRGFLSGIYNACRYHKNRKTLLNRCVEDPRQNSSGMTANLRGFTLIELLVVVLIIGILTAVALPQYQKAVIKARLVEIQTLVTAYARDIEMYRLEHGTYPTSDQWNDIKDSLNVEFSACNFSGSYISCPSIIIDMYPLGWQNRALLGYSKNFQIGFVKWFADSTYPDRRECLAHINSALANDVCKSFGGLFTREYKYSNFIGQWNAYELP